MTPRSPLEWSPRVWREATARTSRYAAARAVGTGGAVQPGTLASPLVALRLLLAAQPASADLLGAAVELDAALTSAGRHAGRVELASLLLAQAYPATAGRAVLIDTAVRIYVEAVQATEFAHRQGTVARMRPLDRPKRQPRPSAISRLRSATVPRGGGDSSWETGRVRRMISA